MSNQDSYTLGAIIAFVIMLLPTVLFFWALFSIRNQIRRVARAIEQQRRLEPKAWP